jgi:prepilin-type N-terminal cleavage/methylation domain-containing protein
MSHWSASVTPASRKRLRRSGGFTVVELLVVIAIMAVLTALVVSGYNGIVKARLVSQTRMTMSNLTSMLAEYEAKQPGQALKRQPPHGWRPDLADPNNFEGTFYERSALTMTPPRTFNFWRDTVPGDNDLQEGLPAYDKSLEEDKALPQDDPKYRTDSAAVLNTQIVMGMMTQVPAVKTLLANVPTEQQMTIPDRPETTSYNESAAPVLLDAWGNPIIFVPASGLRDLYFGDAEPPGNYVATSARMYSDTELPQGVVAPNARPFFVSAGPDQNFGGYYAEVIDVNGKKVKTGKVLTYADDNIYSFER